MILVTSINLYFDPDPAPRFSITVDDTADLLAELARQPKKYPSLFDHPVLAFARDLHRRYGAVFTFFFFYQGTTYPQFDLSQTPDKFRDEWAQNASWLHLGFHARAMLPTTPYAQATAAQALDDFDAVRDQVLRFAGPQIWDPLMRSHYWSGNRDCVRTWHQAGIQGVYGAVPGYKNYYLSPARSDVVNQCDYWWDQTEDLLFTQTDIWIERDFRALDGAHTTVGTRVPGKLDSLFRQPYASQNVQVFTHESFLFDHDITWQVRQRLEEVTSWLVAHGYESRFDSETPFFTTLLPPPDDLRLANDSATLLTLSWSHRPRQNPCRYQVYRRDLANLEAAWLMVGKETGTRFSEAWRAGVYAYRVYAVDAAGQRSAGSPLLRVSFHPVPDFNGDETVDMEDFFALAQHVGQRRGEPAYNSIYDLNGDGKVDQADLTDFRRGFGRVNQPVKRSQ